MKPISPTRPIAALAVTACMLAAGMLASCSSRDVAVPCPSITTHAEAAQAFILTDSSRQLVDVCFNGVKASCNSRRNGDVRVEIEAGLKAKRSLSQSKEADIATIAMAAAIVGDDDVVVKTETFGYRIGFGKGDAQKYPIAEFSFDLAPTQRLIVMLTPTLE